MFTMYIQTDNSPANKIDFDDTGWGAPPETAPEDAMIKCKMALCECGGSTYTAVAKDGTFSKETLKEFAACLKAGYDIVSVSLETARTTQMCFNRECRGKEVGNG